MTNTFPSLFSTYKRASLLWSKTFIDLLPFLLLWMLSQIALEYFLPQTDKISATFFITLFLDMAITTLFFGVILNGLYQRYRDNKFDFMMTLKTGFKRFIPLYTAYFLVSLPMLVVLFAFGALLHFGKQIGMTWIMNIISMQHVIIACALFLSLVLAVLFFMAGVFIVIFKNGAFRALKHSYHLVKQYWMDTLLVILLFGIIAAFASLLLVELNIPYTKALITLALSSFYPALMIIHYENLVKYAKQIDVNVIVEQTDQKFQQG
jgi:hypothetical protein